MSTVSEPVREGNISGGQINLCGRLKDFKSIQI